VAASGRSKTAQPLLAPHVRDAHPPRHLRPVPLPRALLPRRRPPRWLHGAEAASTGVVVGLRGSGVPLLLLRRLRCRLVRPRLSGRRNLVVRLGRSCLRRPLLGRLQVGDRRPLRDARRFGFRRRRHAANCQLAAAAWLPMILGAISMLWSTGGRMMKRREARDGWIGSQPPAYSNVQQILRHRSLRRSSSLVGPLPSVYSSIRRWIFIEKSASVGGNGSNYALVETGCTCVHSCT
jgi:hypothetical protein